MRRFLVTLALVAMCVATVAPAAAARERPTGLTLLPRQPGSGGIEVIQGSKSLSGRIAQSDADLLARRDSNLVNVLIKFDFDAVASYRGDVEGLRPTSPSVTGRSLNQNAGAVNAYRQVIDRQSGMLRRAIRTQVPNARLGTTFLTAYGGVAARLPANQAKRLLDVRGIVAVQYDRLEKPLTDASPDFIGASSVWPSLGGSSEAGQGVIVGILDTGIWPEHPSFADPGIAHPGGSYDCDFGDGSDPDLGAAFTCNDKLIGAYTFLDTNLLVGDAADGHFCNDANDDCTARDSDGHGTHTSSTAAGSPVASAVLYGVERGPISGIAPGAHIIHYRVCLEGCYTSDSMAAVEQAIMDDVDVLNFSISGGSNAYSDGVELAFLDAYAAGILVNASAGNDGPGAATANHAGPWTNTVGASTSDRHFLTTLHLTATGGPAPLTLDIPGVTITDGISSPTPVVLGKDTVSGELCDTAASGTDYDGMVVACQRGVIARVEKGFNVLEGSAEGMILYNVGQTDLETDNHYVPTIHLNDPGESIEAFVGSHTGVMATWSTGVASPVTGDVMADFSSRGPLGDFIKPDVTAPGIQILAGNSPDHVDDPAAGLGPDGELFQAIAGTSMSSPHAAGVAALVKAAHPGWTPGQIKSAMMTSSVQSVLKEDGATPADPFDRGAGSIRANRAVKPTVTFDVNPVDFYLSAGDPFGRIDLNLASVNAPQLDGTISTTRRIRNVSGTTQTLNLSTSGGSGKISVSPSKLTLGPNQTKAFTVTINATALADGWYFGQIKLNPKKSGYLNAIVPVAFNKAPGDVLLDTSCDSGTVEKGTEVECEVTVTNFAADDAHVSVRVMSKNPRKVKLNDWSAGSPAPKGFRWNGTLGPALPPSVDGLLTPGDGFLDLAGEGWDPESAFDVDYGDETLVNYPLAEVWGIDGGGVRFGDVAYDTIGVTSNGYLIFGEGESADIDFVPQEMPDPVRPNAVLAPFWTDLNFDDGGEVYFGAYGDASNIALFVIQWDAAPIWGTCPPPDTDVCETRTFQVWIATDYGATTYFGGDDYITFEYDASDIGPGSADGLNVGAEDALGLTAADVGVDTTQTFVPDTGGYYVDTGVTTAGGSMTITYDARGRRLGSTKLITTMTSDVTPGTARRSTPITVVP